MKLPDEYNGEPLCPRCGNGYPCCADRKPDGTRYTHDETCRTYFFDASLCSACDAEMEAS